MSQIEELQRRIAAAMDRIGAGVEILSSLPAPVAEVAETQGAPDTDLLAALEDEKLANAQLEERLKVLKARHEVELAQRADGDGEELAALRAHLDEAQALLSERAGAEEAAASAANAVEDLRTENDVLRVRLESVEDAEPLKAEIENLRAAMADTEQARDLRTENDMLRAERVSHGAAMARLDDDLQRLRKANEQLREVNGALREANAAGVGDPELINHALQAELEALRSARATDMAEAQAVLAQLEPLLAQAELVEGEEA
ncbi:hypothetical protein [Ruegeria hyattellae]|uniref:hypothetical protein n=1 Tax=Ruegeria hyattellae TaxID=3233337 RepID=UPI00355C055F